MRPEIRVMLFENSWDAAVERLTRICRAWRNENHFDFELTGTRFGLFASMSWAWVHNEDEFITIREDITACSEIPQRIRSVFDGRDWEVVSFCSQSWVLGNAPDRIDPSIIVSQQAWNSEPVNAFMIRGSPFRFRNRFGRRLVRTSIIARCQFYLLLSWHPRTDQNVSVWDSCITYAQLALFAWIWMKITRNVKWGNRESIRC